MKIRRLRIHNFRSILDADVEVHDYLMLVGANNAGKSNLLAALRAFYDDIKWSGEDVPKVGGEDGESWVELTYELTSMEWAGLAEKYKIGTDDCRLVLRRYFKSQERVRVNQSNIYAILNDVLDNELFYGAKNVGTAKIGHIVYIPALTTVSDQMKTTGPSPLRDMLHFMLRQVVSHSEAYGEVEAAFSKLNDEARATGGFLEEIVRPLNSAIEQWGIRFDLSVNAVTPDDIIKNLVKPGFADTMLDDAVLALERYGHGFQRSFLYELIQLAPRFVEQKKNEKKEFDPDFTLILFEEPEAFLHPAQQENMAYQLRQLGRAEGRQVIITSHSPIFVGKAADDLCRLVRIYREQGRSVVKQIIQDRSRNLLEAGLEFRRCLQAYVNDVGIPENQKKEARKLLTGVERDKELAMHEENFRYQLWLDSDRASMFFADRVLLVEGPTEKALFSWLWAHNWHDEFAKHRIAVVDVMGKYNFHRFIALLEAFGIPYGLMLDDDADKQHHRAINEMLKYRSEPSRLAAPVFLEHCMETFLGLPIPERGDRKPIQILNALEQATISSEKLNELKKLVVKSLALVAAA